MGIDIQKENNLIQEAFEVEADEVGFCLDKKWGDYENPYENSDTALAFNLFKKGWQAKAQAVPEAKYILQTFSTYSGACEQQFNFKNIGVFSSIDGAMFHARSIGLVMNNYGYEFSVIEQNEAQEST